MAPRLVAVAGAKGGTGKSLVAANIGVFLASLGRKVVLLDAAFGSPSLHSFVGVGQPSRSLAEFFAQEDTELSEVIVPTRVSNLGLIPGQSDPAWASDPRGEQLQRLRCALVELEVDYVVLDLAPGTHKSVTDLFLDAEMGLVVTSAEPTAIEMVYRFLKATFVRKLLRNGLGHIAKMSVQEAQDYEGGIAAPSDLLSRAVSRYGEDHEDLAALKGHMKEFVAHLVLNMARSKADIDLGKDLCGAATRRFGTALSYLGPVENDDAVWVSLRRRRPLLVEHPESRASKGMEGLTRRLLALETVIHKTPDLSGATHYDLLGVAPTASDEAIRRANRHVRRVYAKDSVVVGGLYSPSRLQRFHQRLDEAYDALIDPVRRREIDRKLFPDGLAKANSLQPRSAVSLPVRKTPALEPDVVFTGAVLRECREALGIELRTMADHTKIGITYLSAIESDSFDKLPATVYVRGFLAEYAKMLQLDQRRVMETYLARLMEGGSKASYT